MKYSILILSVLVSFVWSENILAKNHLAKKHLKKQPKVGQKYTSNQPRPAVYKSAQNKFKKRTVSSLNSNKKKN